MRLAQIARKVQTPPTQIIKHIEQNFETTISSAPNTKIPEEYVQNILEHFGQSTAQKEEKTVSTDQPLTKAQSELQPKEEKAVTPPQEDEAPSPTNEANLSESPLAEKTKENQTEPEALNIEDGVIKAPKVEVQGIKVVDKIELPTKKEEETEDGEEKEKPTSSNEELSNTTAKEEPETKPKKTQKRKKQSRKPNVPSYEEQLKKDNAAYEKKLKEKREKEKQKKKSHYEKMMKERQKRQKQKSSKKAKSNTSKSNDEQTTLVDQTKESPKTAWGKFIKWLNT